MQEERRLMYVAITRAQKKLYLTRASSRFLYGNRQYTAQSSFLNELAPKLGIARPRVNSFDFYQRRERSSYSSDYDSGYKADEPSSSSDSLNFSFNARNFSAKPKQVNSEVSGYKTGKKVQHAKFGTGTVIMVKGEGKNIVVDVAFPGVGIKSLAVAYAPLKLLD